MTVYKTFVRVTRVRIHAASDTRTASHTQYFTAIYIQINEKNMGQTISLGAPEHREENLSPEYETREISGGFAGPDAHRGQTVQTSMPHSANFSRFHWMKLATRVSPYLIYTIQHFWGDSPVLDCEFCTRLCGRLTSAGKSPLPQHICLTPWFTAA